jgi:hypothetical protein
MRKGSDQPDPNPTNQIKSDQHPDPDKIISLPNEIVSMFFALGF